MLPEVQSFMQCNAHSIKAINYNVCSLNAVSIPLIMLSMDETIYCNIHYCNTIDMFKKHCINIMFIAIYCDILQYVTEFWKTYHLQTSEILRIFNFAPLWL